jgi:uncharacterized protein (UPF0332 family)
MNKKTYTRALIDEYIAIFHRALPLVKKYMSKTKRKYSSITLIRFDQEFEQFICSAFVSSKNGESKTSFNVDLNWAVELIHEAEEKKKEKARIESEKIRMSFNHPNGLPKKPRNPYGGKGKPKEDKDIGK